MLSGTGNSPMAAGVPGNIVPAHPTTVQSQRPKRKQHGAEGHLGLRRAAAGNVIHLLDAMGGKGREVPVPGQPPRFALPWVNYVLMKTKHFRVPIPLKNPEWSLDPHSAARAGSLEGCSGIALDSEHSVRADAIWALPGNPIPLEAVLGLPFLKSELSHRLIWFLSSVLAHQARWWHVTQKVLPPTACVPCLAKTFTGIPTSHQGCCTCTRSQHPSWYPCFRTGLSCLRHLSPSVTPSTGGMTTGPLLGLHLAHVFDELQSRVVEQQMRARQQRKHLRGLGGMPGACDFLLDLLRDGEEALSELVGHIILGESDHS